MKQAEATRHPRVIACDANISPEDFEKSMWFQKQADVYCSPGGVDMQVERPKRVRGLKKKHMITSFQVTVSGEIFHR